MSKLYLQVEESLNTYFDIVKIIRNLRNQKILIQDRYDKEQIREMVSKSKKVLINLDSEEDDLRISKLSTSFAEVVQLDKQYTQFEEDKLKSNILSQSSGILSG